MRKLVLIVLPLCVLYFFVGGVLLWMKVLDEQMFLKSAGIVGALASIFGLFSFLRPAITRTDIQNIEVESLARMAQVTGQVTLLEREREKTATAIGDLERQKKEMELAVHKASLALFLRDQKKHHEEKILRDLEPQTELVSSISELISIGHKLTALEEEIETDENVDLLKDLIDSARSKPSFLDSAIEQARSPFRKALLRSMKAYSEVFSRSFFGE